LALRCTLTVNAGNHRRAQCPVTAYLPWSYRDAHSVELVDIATKDTIPCQVIQASSGIRVTWIIGKLEAGSTRRLRVRGFRERNRDERVKVEEQADVHEVKVTMSGKPFTTYHHGHQWVRPFLHPVIGPYDTPVTRSWPIRDDVKGEEQDYPHHKSLWVAYGECGRVDNWSELPGHGSQIHRAFSDASSGSVYGRIAAKTEWMTANNKPQFEDTRDIRMYALRGGEKIVDVSVTLRMTRQAVTFRGTKEGGLLCVRTATPMEVRHGGAIENACGAINQDEAWGRRSPWCDYSGRVHEKSVGIAVMDHEDNPRHPTYWHVRNYGLMTANCFGVRHFRPSEQTRGDMTFRKGSATTWRYRVYIHKGDARRGRVAEKYCDYVYPPTITVDS